MEAIKIKSALKDITAEQDPTLKSLKMASLCTALWAEHGVELVVVGGSAIEILTDGAYTSGDLDFCHTNRPGLPLRQRQELMGLLNAKGDPRSWEVAGMFVDLLGAAESYANTPYRRVQGPYGEVRLMKPEDLLVERILVSFYPERSEAMRKGAKSFLAVILRGGVLVDWNEVRRLANRPEYRILPECEELVKEVADELKIQSPLHSDSN